MALEDRVASLETELKAANEKIAHLFSHLGLDDTKSDITGAKKFLSKTPRPSRPATAGGSVRNGSKTPRGVLTMPIEKKHRREPTNGSAAADEKVAVDPSRVVQYYVGKKKQHMIIPNYVDPASFSTDAPSTNLTLDYVYGFNGKAARHNLHVNKENGQLVYSVAATGVIFDPATNTQRFFIGHNEDILCLAVHPTRPLAATGQLDPKGKGTPYTCIWNTTDGTEVTRITYHDRGVCAVAFSHDGKYLLTIGNDDSHTLAIFDWEKVKGGNAKAVPLLDTMTSKDDVYGIEVNPVGPTEEKAADIEFLVFGSKVIKHWSVSKLGEADKKNRVHKSRMISVQSKTNIVQKSYMSAAFLPNGEYLVGCQSGHIYRMKGESLVTFFAAHAKSVGCIRAVDGGYYSAGADGKLIQWDNDNKQVSTLDIAGGGSARSLSIFNGIAYVGTASNTLVQIDLSSQEQTILQRGHTDEVWALAIHPSQSYFVSGAFDKKILIWDYKEKRAVADKSSSFKASVKCAAFSPDGKYLAVGQGNGNIRLIEFDSFTQVWDTNFAKETIDGIAFSPDGSLIAAGSWDQKVYLIDTATGVKKAGMSGHTSSVLFVNFTEDGKYLMSDSKDYEKLYWDVAEGKRLKDRAVVNDAKWAGWNCFLGWPVAGIWANTGDGTDINAVSRSNNEQVIAAGDDFGMVRLYKYPAVNKSQGKEFPGHSSHVANVRFSPDDAFLFSAGGGDCGVFQWTHA